MQFKIIKRDKSDVMLWRFPDARNLWATEKEFDEFCSREDTYVLGEGRDGTRQFLRGRYLAEKCERSFCGDFAAEFLANIPDATAEPVSPVEEQRKWEFRNTLTTHLAMLCLGFLLAVWLVVP